MKIASIAHRVHVQVENGFVDVAEVIPDAPSSLLEILQQGSFHFLEEALQYQATSPLHCVLDAPIHPQQMYDFYSFEGHVRNARAKRQLDMLPEWYQTPTYYRCNPRQLVPPGGTVLFPAEEQEPDFELELACVIGRSLYRPQSLDEARKAIFGYTLFNDWSARQKQRLAMKIGLGPNPGKDFASSLGPIIVTPDEIPSVDTLVMTAEVNGEKWTTATFGESRWDFAEMIAFVAEICELAPGDVIGSGTVPLGCGFEHGKILPEGARVVLHCEPIGDLEGIVGRAAPARLLWKK